MALRAPQNSGITVLAKHTVKCAHPSSLDKLGPIVRLGPIDQLLFPIVPVAVVFLYPNSSSTTSTELLPVSRLQRALELLLDYYPHLTGRFQTNTVDNTPEIVNLGYGAEISSASCKARLDDFRSAPTARLTITDLPDGGNALLAPYMPVWEEICKNPVFTIMHTRFACGGVTLGVRLPHILCDADGFFQVMRDLAELYRGLSSGASPDSLQLSQPTINKSYMSDPSDMTEEERQAAQQFKPWLYTLAPQEPAPSAVDEAPAALGARSVVLGRVIRFLPGELDAIKEHASDNSHGGFVSTFDALAAHLCQRVYHARLRLAKESGVAESEISSDFLAPVNQRSKDRLDLGSRYFPNAGLATFFTIPPATLGSGALSQVARLVHEGVRKVGKEEARSSVKWIVVQPDKSKIRPGFRLDRSIFMASQWCKFDMYAGMHFDVIQQEQASQPTLIQPELVFPPFTPISLVDGLTYFVATEDQLKSLALSPSTSNKEAIDVAMALIEPLWKILDEDPDFRKFRAT